MKSLFDSEGGAPRALPDAADLYVLLGKHFRENHEAMVDAVIPILRKRFSDMLAYMTVYEFYGNEMERLANKYEFFMRALLCRSYDDSPDSPNNLSSAASGGDMEEDENEDEIEDGIDMAVEIISTRFVHKDIP
jgi:hypothetical protein